MKKVRCYSLNAIIRLCYGIFDLKWSDDLEEKYPLQTLNEWQSMSQTSSSLAVSLDKLNLAASRLAATHSALNNNNNSNNSNSNSNNSSNYYNNNNNNNENLHPSSSTSQSETSTSGTTPLLKLIGSANKRYIWKNQTVLQDYVYKLPNSKDTISVHTYQTSAYIFVALLFRNSIFLYQRRRENVNQVLQPLKEFWIPAETQNISFADDRTTLRYIAAVFPNGAALIELQSSKVQSIPIDSKVEQLYETACLKQIFEKKVLYPNESHSTTTTISSSSSSYEHYHNQQMNRSITSRFGRSHSNPPIPNSQTLTPITITTATSPSSPSSPPHSQLLPTSISQSKKQQYNYTPPTTIQFTSLLQLPFHPKNAPSVTEEYSIPPSYTTVMTRTPFEASDPIPLPSDAIPQLFFATFGCHSMIIDMKGSLFTTQVYTWMDSPDRIVFLRMQSDTWCAVGFTKESVLMMDFTTATCQRMMHGVPVRFLGKMTLPSSSVHRDSHQQQQQQQIKKKDTILFSVNNNEKSHQIYSLSSLDEA
ncbi:unnamed protein product [Cunninghamella echinulata]